jgi:hypothetical protein
VDSTQQSQHMTDFFQGAIRFEPYERIWKTWAPGKCRFFLWLVAHNRCWTADRLAQCGLDHPTRYLHCDQDSETINHLLVDCVFARDFWYSLLQKIGMQSLLPQQGEASFECWWARTNEALDGLARKVLNSIIILGAWTLWNHRNRCVFDGASPNLARALTLFFSIKYSRGGPHCSRL